MENNLIIEDKDIEEAEFMSRGFVDIEKRNRAYFNALKAELVSKFLVNNGIKVDSSLDSLHSISKVVEYIDISDILLDNIYIEVRSVIDKKFVPVPKSHYKYKIQPDVYVVIDIDEDFKNAKICGYFTPDKIDKNKCNEDYYFVTKNQLVAPDNFIDFVRNFQTKKYERLSDLEVLKGRELSVIFADDNLAQDEVKYYLNLLIKDPVLRSSVLEFDNFEKLSYNVSPSMVNIIDNTQGIALDTDIVENENKDEISVSKLDESALYTPESLENNSLNQELLANVEEQAKLEELENKELEGVEMLEFQKPITSFDINEFETMSVDDILDKTISSIDKNEENDCGEVIIDETKIDDLKKNAITTALDVAETTAEIGMSAAIMAEQFTNNTIEKAIEDQYSAINKMDIDKSNLLNQSEIDEDFKNHYKDVKEKLREDVGYNQAETVSIDSLENVVNDEKQIDNNHFETVDFKDIVVDKETVNNVTDINFNDDSSLDNLTDLKQENESIISNINEETNDLFDNDIFDTSEQFGSSNAVVENNELDTTEMFNNDIFGETEQLDSPEEVVENDELDNLEFFNNNVENNYTETIFKQEEDVFSDVVDEQKVVNQSYEDEFNKDLFEEIENDSIEYGTLNEMQEDNLQDIDYKINEESSNKDDDDSTVISNRTFSVGEIKIGHSDKNYESIEEPIPNLQDIYNEESNINNTMLRNPGTIGTNTENKNKKGMGFLVGLIVLLLLAGGLGFGVMKMFKPPVDEIPQPTTDEVNNFESKEMSNVPGQVNENIVNMVDDRNSLSTAVKPAEHISNVSKPQQSKKVVNLDVSKISWKVADYVAYDQNFKNYFQSVGRNLKLLITNDLLLATDYAYSNVVDVSISFNKDGSFKNAQIITSSGSTQIDNIILQSIKTSLSRKNAPHSLRNDENTTAILKIYF